MKKVSLSSLLLAVSFSIIATTGCTKKTAQVIPLPGASANPATAATGTTDNFQNTQPFQQGVGTNQAYYQNGAAVSDDTSGFSNPAGGATDPNAPATGAETPTKAATAPTDPAAAPTDPAATDPNAPVATDPAAGGTDPALDIPSDIPSLQPYSPPGGANGGSNGYSLSGNFKVDQDNYVPTAIPYIGQLAPSKNQWQAVGVAVSGANVVVSAFDNSGFLKKGTIITMSNDQGANWKNVGSQYFGTKHPMDGTVKGITVDANGKIYSVDSVKYLYSQSGTAVVTKVDAGISGGLDIVSVGTNLFVATTGGIKKFDPATLTGGTDFAAGVMPTAGMGSDKDGNIYVVVGSIIKKITPDGKATDAVKDAKGAIDVTVTDTGNICVLNADGVTMYDKDGKQLSTFGQGDSIAPTAIASSGKDIYVADSGQTYVDSQIVKYSILTL